MYSTNRALLISMLGNRTISGVSSEDLNQIYLFLGILNFASFFRVYVFALSANVPVFKLTIIATFFFHLNSLTEAGNGGRLFVVFLVTCLFNLFVFSVCFGSKSVFNQFM